MDNKKLIVGLIVAAVFGGAAFAYVQSSLGRTLNDIARLAENYARRHGGLLPKTGAVGYCHGGGALLEGDSVFATLGFDPSIALPPNADFYFNVSSDRNKVALSAAASPLENEVNCLVVDLSGAVPKRSEVTRTERCLP